MNTVRSQKATYVASFLLGALIALFAATPARSAEPFRLDRIAVVRFTAEGDGRLRQQHAVLHHDGRLNLRGSFVVPRPADTPDWVLGRILVPLEAWQAYVALGTGALARFELRDGGARVEFGGIAFLLVAPSFEEPAALGRLINLSTRVPIGAGNVATVGFVVDAEPRAVLIRAVGPTLQKFGIGAPASDPFLSLKRNGQTIYFNDNWNDAAEATAIRDAAVRVGAFPLDEGARDAARLLLLPPGVYTLAIETTNPEPAGREVLVEIYSVPPDVVEIYGGSAPGPAPH